MSALAAKQPLAGGFTRRGACPALSAPMQTGDGLLVRLNPVAGGLSPAQLAGLCDAAGMFGNGVIEVTARGSMQVRGLTSASAAPFAEAIDRLGIAVRTGVPVQAGVLAGLDPDEIVDPTALADMIRAAIARDGLEARLGPKVSVVVDGGARTALDEVAADVRLTAVRVGGSPAWQVAIAGDARAARTLGVVHGDTAACEATLALLAGVADMGREARARDLSGKSLPALPSSSGLSRGFADLGGSGKTEAAAASMSVVTDRLVADPRDKPWDDGVEQSSLIGIANLRDDRVALGVALPFGHTTANALKTFAEAARALGVGDIRPAPKRTLVAICGTVAQAETLRKQAETLDFVTAPDDPRQAISACPGAPDCASGHIPARQIAAEITWEYSSLLDGSIHLHVSGCAKGCAHPAVSALTVVGSETGTGFILDGTARDQPAAFAENDGAGRALANVAKRVSAERRTGETTAQTIQRLGLSALAEAFRQGGK
ncbi:precorrin-3B synthase [Mesorhizobium sp. YM1C-6-2]|uniref:precorrin-3B synthase n=1 Tax=Mesorhizobium sp. YM1C-6-2 TaxID=1827501 RepID=UPI000EF228DD|nr:precorrin-3B synthase [Mesorhizobium sp. YM1C-6-2]RLP24230.1 precorrin-3B synthase [Mesorhizobium sp. YM1C-6-2]